MFRVPPRVAVPVTLSTLNWPDRACDIGVQRAGGHLSVGAGIVSLPVVVDESAGITVPEEKT